MKNLLRRAVSALLGCALGFFLLPVAVPAAETEPVEEIRFLSYEEALTYFDFDTAARNWCFNFGWDAETRLADARQAILDGTDPELVIRLATYARDTGHGEEKLVVTNAFRPACYQEVIGLHDSNANTGPYRAAMSWNGRSVTKFWWSAESAAGWPEQYSIDLSDYDLATLDLDYYYRAALRLWDNGWVANYYAKPGCSAHNSGTAIDLGNYWIATNFATSYEYNGRSYAMADYGLYKPLQPSAGSAGEQWHITCSPAVSALGNYDHAFAAGFEVVYALYYNPASRGWSMADGRGVYLGAGVTVIQIRLCQLGLLEQKYITGYYCTKTEEAVKIFQRRQGLEDDGICGVGTLEKLLPETVPPADDTPPVLTRAEVISAHAKGFRLYAAGEDDGRLAAFRVDTRPTGAEDDAWVVRYYNAPATGEGILDVDIWVQGDYDLRVAAVDAAGNESELWEPGGVFVDATPPTLRRVTVSNIVEDGFTVSARGEDDAALAGFRVTLRSDTGKLREEFFAATGYGEFEIRELSEGTWTITVTAVDTRENESGYTFAWTYAAGAAQEGVSVTHFG